MIEEHIDIPTADGEMTTFTCRPERDGPFPVIFIYMDAHGIREELRDMARRVASVGYYVLLPNLYYRSAILELNLAEPKTADDPPRSPMRDLVNSLTVGLVLKDTAAMLEYVEARREARSDTIACVGYCMSAQHAINAAARYPGRVAAAASIYGTWLMTQEPDSPHIVARRSTAEFYFACAEIDPWAPLEMVAELRRDFSDARANAEVEVYAGVEHGFAFPQRPTYDKPAAERHWERLFSLFKRRLQSRG